jgi:hypothetical protein
VCIKHCGPWRLVEIPSLGLNFFKKTISISLTLVLYLEEIVSVREDLRTMGELYGLADF